MNSVPFEDAPGAEQRRSTLNVSLRGKHLERRTFLRGMGAAIALPMLDAMIPAFAAPGKAAQAPLRTSFVYVPNGIVMDNWTPKTAGKASSITRTLNPWNRSAIACW